MMLKKIVKHGNTYAVVLPKDWIKAYNIRKGSYVLLAIGEGGTIHLRHYDRELAALARKMAEEGDIDLEVDANDIDAI